MPYVKRIVCLANSYKIKGRCIVGREVLENARYGQWIRPVSARTSAEVSFSEYRYRDNASPKLLDIIDVPLFKPAPQNHQTENHMIENARWVKRGELSWHSLEQLRERPASLWVNQDHTFPGHYDCMSQSDAAAFENSLLLIRTEDFVVGVHSRMWDGIKTKIYRGKFDYNGSHYNLALTDPVARDAFSAKPAGDYPLNDVYLCISLTEQYQEDGRCHKLVAAIISNPPL